MDKKIEFLYNSINDTQSTIRAVDVKVAAILVGILAPLSKVDRVFSHLGNVWGCNPEYIFYTIVISFIVLWILSLVSIVSSIAAIDNPSSHIINADQCTGSFYGEKIYNVGLVDVFINRDVVRANNDPRSFSEMLPINVGDIELELVYEKLKLVYIRDVKINRLKWGLIFSLLWFFNGIFIYLYSKYVII